MKYFLQVFSVLALIGISFSIYEILSRELNDEFNMINLNTWNYESRRSFGQNSNMFKEAVSIEEGAVTIAFDTMDVEVMQRYKSGGLSSLQSFTDGVFKIRAKQEAAAGTVCSIKLESPWRPEKNGIKEISINLLGSSDSTVFLSARDINFSVGEVAYDHEYRFENSTSREFHEYEIIWQDSQVEFYVDGKKVFETNKILYDEPMNIKLNQWAVNQAEIPYLYEIIGPVDEKDLPSKLVVDRVSMKPFYLYNKLKLPFKF